MKKLLQFIWNCIKRINSVFTFFRNAFLNLIFFILLLIVMAGFFSSSNDEEKNKSIDNNSILHIIITGKIVEQRPIIDPVDEFFNTLNDTPKQTTYLQDILDAINSATNNNNIACIMINSTKMSHASLEQLRTIGDALKKFRKSGKNVIAAADYYRQSDYLLASYADTIIMNPMGSVNIHGMGHYSLYFREALDKFKVQYNIFRVGTYKAAVEPFLRNSMSEEDRIQSASWLNALWQEYCSQIENNRKLKKNSIQHFTEAIQSHLKNASGDSAVMAKQQKFVDELLTRPQIDDYFYNLLKIDSSEELPLISVADYLTRSQTPHSYKKKNGNIAIIIAEGTILDGKWKENIGGDSLSEQIETARKNEKIKALVLRINSGGGSAFASEIIRQELLTFKKSGKKLIVSMGAIAASGGYWISTVADEIWAAPSTLTGSIGVFGAIPTFEDSLKSLGVHSDGVGTTPLSGGIAPIQALNPINKELIQRGVEHTYDRFLSIVATGRKLEKDYVEQIAEGRVYDGRTAQEKNLVDKMGNLTDAIDAAAKLADIRNPLPQYIEPKRNMSEQLLQIFSSVQSKIFTTFAKNIPASMVGIFSNFFKGNATNTMLPIIVGDPNYIYSYTPYSLIPLL